MTNEQLVVLAQRGDRAALEELWATNQGIVYRIVSRYCKPNGYYDIDDLGQVAFIGIAEAVQSFDTAKGVLFMSYADFYIRKAARELTGLRGRRRLDDCALPLDAPMSNGQDTTLCDTLEDSSLPDMGELAALEDTRRIVRETVGRLPPELRRTVRAIYWQERRICDIAAEDGVNVSAVHAARKKALRALKRDIAIVRLRLDTPTRYYAHKGMKAFRSSWSSSVEDVVLHEIGE